jgi:hypothetical protein
VTSRSDLTGLLLECGRGYPNALNALLLLVYAELRRIAADQLRRVSPTTAKREWRTAKAWLTVELGLEGRA